MKINADFTQRAVVHADRTEWVTSPMPGVHRRMLDRVGAEVARATTLVRYAPGSAFSAHTHDGGEEFVVVDGVFQDEHGDYPAGSYIRNPPGTRHTPSSAPGCVIFVKLWQFEPTDATPVKVNTHKMASVRDATRAGVSITPLFQDARESVRMETWDAHAHIHLDLPGGGEFLVMDGSFTDSGEHFHKDDWLRLPLGSQLNAQVGPQGARVWVKTGHLRFVDIPAGVSAANR